MFHRSTRGLVVLMRLLHFLKFWDQVLFSWYRANIITNQFGQVTGELVRHIPDEHVSNITSKQVDQVTGEHAGKVTGEHAD